MDIGTSTQLCAVIGNPVEHSLSPAIHNRAFQELGLDFVYLAFRVEDTKSVAMGMRALENFRGLSVTIPHKVAIIEHLDEIAEVDRQIGSVNTVVNENGKLIGSGSDGPGARMALLDSGVELTGQRVIMLGSGGASRAIAFDLAHHAKPSSLVILGVIEDELTGLVEDLKAKTDIPIVGEMLDEKSLPPRVEEAQVVIHATPIGMHPKTDASLVPKELMHSDLAIMDVVYNPLKTKLLRDAESVGLKTVSGADMFVNQALFQFEIWTGQKAPKEIMREVVINSLQK
ncbi:MAG: shikimate dehydrogenase [Proteobacteria bacterium]|nr:shikimate dehydrogenase [Pseudomonadota bacterium]